MSRNWGVHVEPVLAGDPLAVERHRLGHERSWGAELGERGPVARDLERRREPRVPRVRNVGRPHEARVVGEQAREPRPRDHRLAGRRQIQRQATVEARVDAQKCDVADGVDLVDHHHPALAHRLHEPGVDQPHGACVVGGGDELVAEQVLVTGRAAGDLHEPVERDAVTVLYVPSAVSPQPVRDTSGQLRLPRTGWSDEPQERRLGRPVGVDQCAGELVDRLAVQPGRVDPLAVRQDDRLAQRVKLEEICRAFGGEVALLSDPVDGGQGCVDRAHARLLSVAFAGNGRTGRWIGPRRRSG